MWASDLSTFKSGMWPHDNTHNRAVRHGSSSYHVPSSMRSIAGLVGFFIFTQLFVRPERYGMSMLTPPLWDTFRQINQRISRFTILNPVKRLDEAKRTRGV